MSDAESLAIERRIEYFLLFSGTVMALAAWLGWGIRPAEGAAIGTAICWLNFRWLKQGAAALIRLGLAQAGAAVVRVPRTIHLKLLGRFALLLLVVYAILVLLQLPAIPFLCGLVAVFPAVVLELFYELLHGMHRWNAP